MDHNNPNKKKKVFVMRITEETKRMLEDLAGNKVFRHNHTALVTHLIHAEYAKNFTNHEKP